MKIYCRTTITPIANDKKIKPKSPLWALFNDGLVTVLVNNNIIIQPNETWGIDVTNLFGIKNISDIENETEFDVRFLILGNTGLKFSCQLIETVFEKRY